MGKTNKTSVFASVLGSWKTNVKIVGPRAAMLSGRVCQVRSTEMIVDSDRHE